MKILDAADSLMILGLVCLTVGLAAIHWPTALIIDGVLFIAASLLAARGEPKDS